MLKRFLTFLSILAFLMTVSPIKSVSAVACDLTDTSKDCNSLRPHPAKPINPDIVQEETVTFCGNSVSVTDSFSVLPENSSNCIKDEKNNSQTCSYSISRTSSVTLDMTKDAELPIMGNTEDVVNKDTVYDPEKPEALNDADKMNQFLSWFLNGVINRAEYPFLATDSSLDQQKLDIAKIINFSGPLKKILSWDVQNYIRKKEVANVGDTRQDQTVACTAKVNDQSLPIPCYQVNAWKDIFGNTPGLNDPTKMSQWDSASKFPPNRLEDTTTEFQNFWLSYINWRGYYCGMIPIIGIYLCFQNPLQNPFATNVKEDWSNLYPYIPFSSTEDRKGSVYFLNASPVTSSNVKLTDVKFSPGPTQTLYFSHMEEAKQLAEILQSTYAPQGFSESAVGDTVKPEETSDCKIMETRTGSGDNLYAGNAASASIDYTVNFSCTFVLDKPQACSKTASITFPVAIEIPLIQDVWLKYVGGSDSLVRKLFPKLGSGSQLGSLYEIPASIAFQSKANGINGSGDVYIPYLGAVSEYALKGIQTLLRPKGFGEAITLKPPVPGNSASGVNCDTTAPEVSIPGLITKDQFYELAKKWIAGGETNKAKECYNDVIKRAQEAGISPVLALWAWVHESDASNYDLMAIDKSYGQDFGVTTVPSQNFVEQINAFFNTVIGRNKNSYLCADQNVTDMQAFAYIYLTGECDANAINTKSHCGRPQDKPESDPCIEYCTDDFHQTGAYYYCEIQNEWSWIAPGIPFPDSAIQ